MVDNITCLIKLSLKTTLAYFVFSVAFFSVPLLRGDDLVVFFFGDYLNDYTTIEKHALIGNAEIKIEIADNQNAQIRGLSGRRYLKDDHGLLFIFDFDDYHKIWMKEMNFPIDIIWLDASLQVIYFEENVFPNTYPKTFSPNQKSRYVLEVPSGFVKDNYIKLGDQMTVL